MLYERITLSVFDGELSDLNACKVCDIRKKIESPAQDCEHYYQCWAAYNQGAIDMTKLLESEKIIDGTYSGKGFATAKMTQDHLADLGHYTKPKEAYVAEWKKANR